MTVNDIFSFLNSKFPVTDAADFDNVGILVGDPEASVSKALISLDCTLDTVNCARKNGCNLIITHHPVIFTPLKNILDGTIVYELVANNLSVISMHTNLDVGVGGVNDCLCKAIGITKTHPVPASDGYLLKGGKIDATTAESFANDLKNALSGSVKFVEGVKPIENVLVCSGSGGDYIETAIQNGFDALVTADVKNHQFLMALDNGVSLFDAGHYNTEDVVVEPLKALLSAEFKNTEFITYHPNSILSV